MDAILRLRHGVLLHTSKLAQLAHACRSEAECAPVAPGTYARWQASVSQVQNELLRFWHQAYPDFLGADSPEAGHGLPARARYVFEYVRWPLQPGLFPVHADTLQASTLFQAAIVYSRTSVFPGQRSIPVASQAEIQADTERRCIAILGMATEYIESNRIQCRHIVFPVLISGIATTQPDAKVQAIDLVRAFEVNGGIGQNTYRTRQLLVAVCEEQRRVVSTGGRMEQVDWMALANERGLRVTNCGL